MHAPTPPPASSVREEIEALAAQLKHHLNVGEPDAAREALTTALKSERLVRVLVTTTDSSDSVG